MITAQTTIDRDSTTDARRPVSLLRRIRAEYEEMPGLTLTVPQAARLWSLTASESLDVLSDLVGSGFLIRDRRGAYRRAGCPRCS
jgi:hypothetical protein